MAEDNGSRTQIMGKPITSDSVLKSLGAVALAVTGWFLSGAWTRIDGMERRQNEFDGRAIRVEERQSEARRMLEEVREDVKEIKRLAQKGT